MNSWHILGHRARRLALPVRRVLTEFGGASAILTEPEPSAPAVVKPKPKPRPIFSISIYAGPNLTAMRSSPEVHNPVLTRNDVTDCQADFVADPFMVRVDSTWHMFFEVLNRKGWRGHIGWATSKDARSWRYRRLVLSEPFHLSYPSILRWNDEYYIVPESYQAGGVRLYRAARFPRKWKLAQTLLHGDYCVDPSIFYHDNRWWMFLETSAADRNDQLRLFHAPDLLGPWSEHVSSPIIPANPHIARPGGRVLVQDDKVVRFTQDCHPAYGIQISAFEVEMTTRSYQEKPLGSGPILGPGNEQWHRCGMHHIDAHRLEDGTYLAAVDGWYEV